MDRRTGHSIPLITKHQHDKLNLNLEAISLIQSFQGPHAFVSICGDYRSGKSFLLNSLFFSGCGFEVSSTTEPCTKGIRIWSQPITQVGVNVWIIDTEGFGSVEQNQAYNGKIFLLSVLLSNIILYNSFGAIDQGSLDKFAMLCRSAHSIDSSLQETKLFWVLRDFSLQMKDRQEKTITPDEYLEMALQENLTNGSKQAKNFLRKLFPQRYCIPLVRPLIDQLKLSQLNNLQFSYLRNEYVQSIYQLRKKILACAAGKSVNGVPVTSSNVDYIFNLYVEMMNEGKIDTGMAISYQRIIKHQNEKEIGKIIEQMELRVQLSEKDMPMPTYKAQALGKELKQLVLQGITKIKSKSEREIDSSEFINELWSAYEDLMLKTNTQNEEALFRQIDEFLVEQINLVAHKVMSIITPQTFQSKYLECWTALKQSYFRKYKKYSHASFVFQEIMQRQQKKIFISLVKSWNEKEKQQQDKNDAVRQAKKTLQEENKKLKEEKIRLIKKLEESKKEQNYNLEKVKGLLQEEYLRRTSELIAAHKQQISSQREMFDAKCSKLYDSLAEIEQQLTLVTNNLELHKRQSEEQRDKQKQKYELLLLKHEQYQNSTEKHVQSTRQQWEQRQKHWQVRANELQGVIQKERKKYQQLSEQHKNNQAQMLQDLAEKNEKILTLRMELAQIEERYREELQKVLTEQKDIICQSINSKIDEYEHRCKVYEHRIQEFVIELAQTTEGMEFEREHLKAISQELTETKNKLQAERADKEQLQAEMKKLSEKNEQERTELGNKIQKAESSISTLKRVLEEERIEHRKELESLEYKLTSSLAMQTSLTEKHSEWMKQTRDNYEAKISEQRSELAKLLNEHIKQLEECHLKNTMLNNQVSRMQDCFSRFRENMFEVRLIYHSETKGNNMQAQEEGCERDDIEHLCQSVLETLQCFHLQLKSLRDQRRQIQQQLQKRTLQLDECQQYVTKARQQNNDLRADLEEAKDTSCLENLVRDLQESVLNYERVNSRLKKQIQLQADISRKREESAKESLVMYKDTIKKLSEENGVLTAEMKQLTAQVKEDRCRLKDLEKQRGIQVPHESEQNSKESLEQEAKIEMLEAQIKRLTKKLQSQKTEVSDPRPVTFGSAVQETRLLQLDSLRKENCSLRKKFEEIREKELVERQEKRTYRIRLQQMEEAKYKSLKDEYEVHKEKVKQTICELQRKVLLLGEEKSALKKQITQVREETSKGSAIAVKIMQEEIDSLKKGKQSAEEAYNKQILALEETFAWTVSQVECKLAQQRLDFDAQKSKQDKDNLKQRQESELTRLKYENIVKMNNMLLGEVEMLKGKANQVTLKEKYKDKIAGLFMN